MSDLISRSTAMKNYCNALCQKLQKGEYCNDCIVKAWLNNQPTAYDIDKVIEELEKIRAKETCNKEKCDTKEICRICVVDDAIEIVKHGVVSDDFCEWKQTSTARYKTSCGYKLEEFFDTNACYCKQCRKKIKVVE